MEPEPYQYVLNCVLVRTSVKPIGDVAISHYHRLMASIRRICLGEMNNFDFSSSHDEFDKLRFDILGVRAGAKRDPSPQASY